jgi:hypothetical protein
MEEFAAPATLWLFAVVGGPVLLALIFGWGLLRSHRRAGDDGGDRGTERLAVQLGALAAATVMVIVLVGWWAGFFG